MGENRLSFKLGSKENKTEIISAQPQIPIQKILFFIVPHFINKTNRLLSSSTH